MLDIKIICRYIVNVRRIITYKYYILKITSIPNNFYPKCTLFKPKTPKGGVKFEYFTNAVLNSCLIYIPSVTQLLVQCTIALTM